MVIMIVGNSGSGKTHIEKEIIKKHNIKPFTIYTNRKKRINEISNYVFTTSEKLKLMEEVEILFKYATSGINEDYYIPYSEMLNDKDRIITCYTAKAAIKLKNKFIENNMKVIDIYLNVTKEQQYDNLLNRKMSKKDIEDRINFENSENNDNYIKHLNLMYIAKSYNYKTDFNKVIKFIDNEIKKNNFPKTQETMTAELYLEKIAEAERMYANL